MSPLRFRDSSYGCKLVQNFIKVQFSLQISDRGGGVTRSEVCNLFHYMYSTAPQPSRSENDSAPLAGTFINIANQSEQLETLMEPPPTLFAGYGYGLPLSRLYARYLLGDLTLTSSEGYGTDAYVFLKALSEDANEMLPVFNHSSTRQYRAPLPNRDWVTFGSRHYSSLTKPIKTSD